MMDMASTQRPSAQERAGVAFKQAVALTTHGAVCWNGNPASCIHFDMTQNTQKNGAALSTRRARTRIALLTAGRRLFAEHPIDAVAIDDIVAAANVAKGSFYNHFEDKDALLFAIVEDIRDKIEERITIVNSTAEDPAARITRAICVYAGVVGEDPNQGRILLHNDPIGSGRKPLNDGLFRDLSAGLHSGRLIIPSIEAGRLYVIGMGHSLLHAAVVRQHAAISDAQQLCTLMLRGFGLGETEAQLIAAQAADDIIRQRAFDQPRE
jgi:AcrR family transcriptional regulator